MTKRMLSLLLALVMTLSLCVPALAADEFAAEAVTEVEEQAPEAPEAPVEPEAEEPAAEEPAVEEPVVVDEPAVAAIVADEPEVITNTAKAESIAKLQEAYDDAVEYEAGVLDGTYHGRGNHRYLASENEFGYDLPETPLGCGYEFLKALYQAKYVLELIDDEKVDEDIKIIEGNVTRATNNLLRETKNLSKKATGTCTYASKLSNNTAFGTHIQEAIDKTVAGRHNSVLTSVKYQVILDNIDKLEHYFQADYLAGLEDALATIIDASALGTKATHADIAAAYKAAKTYDAAEKLGTAAIYPTADQVQAMKDALAAIKAECATGNYTAGSVAAVKAETYGESRYGDNGTWYDSTANGVLSTVTLGNVNDVLDIVKAAYGKLVTNKMSGHITAIGMSHFTSKVSVTVNLDITDADDDYAYRVGVEVNGVPAGSLATISGTSSNSTATIDITKEFSDWRTRELVPADTLLEAVLYGCDDGTWDDASAVEVDRYEWVVNPSTAVTYQFDSKCGFFPSKADAHSYLWKDTENTIYVTLNKKVQSANVRLLLTSPSGTQKAITTGLNGSRVWSADLTTIFTKAADQLAGDYLVEVQVKSDTDPDEQQYWASDDSVYVTVGTIDEYTGYAEMQAAAEKLDGYEELVSKDVAALAKNQATTNAAAQKAAKDALAAVVAETKPNFSSVRTNVDTVTQKLKDAAKGLVEPADMSELEALIAEAEALDAADYEKNTWTTFTKSGVIKAAKDYVGYGPYPNTYKGRNAIKAQVKALQDAIDDLVAVPADNTALKTSIEAAKKAYDATKTYTDASKKAYDDALAAAEAVAADEDATQSEINAAKAALDAAVKGLTVKPAEPTLPTAPAGWSGWKQDAAGNYYYFRNGEMKKNYWVTDASAHDLWYHVGADGKMDTGFKYIVDKTHGAGWFMLQATTTNGMIGAALTGFQATGTAAGNGYFEPTHNGHYAECTWTKAWGDNNFKTGVWGDGQQHVG